MINVRIIKNWNFPDIFQQTPGGSGVWENIHFTSDPIDECDYVIVSNYSTKDIELVCPPENVWCVLQEPPNEFFSVNHIGQKFFSQIFTQDISLHGERYIQSQPALPWHIHKTYDELKTITPPRKSKTLSWVTSNKTIFQGHKNRMMFLSRLKKGLTFDLYGHGFHELNDKWDGLAPYTYSLAIENFHTKNYWSEKLADCFLAWTMPIYYGCTNITEFFPQNSMIHIDIQDPLCIQKIQNAIDNNYYEKNYISLVKARNLVLEKYQFFPYFSDKIKKWERSHPKQKREKIKIKKHTLAKNTLSFFFSNIQRIFSHD